MNVPIAFDMQMYLDFVQFWDEDEHDPDLSGAFRAVCWSCEPPRKLEAGPRLVQPKQDYALAARLLGEADARRLLHGREELLEDEAFRCRVGLRLWEVADAAPHNDEQDLTYQYRHHPSGADLWQDKRQERLQRLERYARRVAALRAKGLDIAMPALPPATGPYAPPPPPASTGSLRTRLSRDEYYALLDFWDHHDHDLAEAIRTIELRCIESWKPSSRGVMPAYSLRRHCAYLAKVLGRRAATRLFWRWEEALTDEAFRYEVGAKLWETIDTAPETPSMALVRQHIPSRHAEDTAAWERKRVPRQRRYALRERALRDAQVERALAAEGVPAT